MRDKRFRKLFGGRNNGCKFTTPDCAIPAFTNLRISRSDRRILGVNCDVGTGGQPGGAFVVQDALGFIPFDVVYLDELDPRKLRSFIEKARRVEELG